MTRILLVEATFPDIGADYKVHAQLIESAPERHRLEVVSLSNPAIAGIPTPGIQRYPVTLPHDSATRLGRQVGTLANLPRAVRDSLRIAEDFQPDVIYSSQQRRDVLLARIIATATDTPLMVHLHYQYGPWLGRLASLILRRADHVVAVSEFVRQTMLLRGVSGDRVSTVHNLTAPGTPSQGDRERVRAELGLGPAVPVVAVVGRLDPTKGIQHLISVLPDLLVDVPDLQVLVCGRSIHQAGYDQYLYDLTDSLNVGSHVKFLGHRDDVPEILGAADVFCLPTEMEAFGLVFIEAMRAGLPVVAFRSGGVPEIVRDGVTGLLSFPQDHDALARNLRTMIDDPEFARTMGRAGRQRLDDAFSPVDLADRWADLVGDVATKRTLGGRGPRRLRGQ